MGTVDRDCNDGRSNSKENSSNGIDQTLIQRQTETGLIRYVSEGVEGTTPFLMNQVNNTSTLYFGDKVKLR